MLLLIVILRWIIKWLSLHHHLRILHLPIYCYYLPPMLSGIIEICKITSFLVASLISDLACKTFFFNSSNFPIYYLISQLVYFDHCKYVDAVSNFIVAPYYFDLAKIPVAHWQPYYFLTMSFCHSIRVIHWSCGLVAINKVRKFSLGVCIV